MNGAREGRGGEGRVPVQRLRGGPVRARVQAQGAGMEMGGRGRSLTCPAARSLRLGQRQFSTRSLPGHGLAVRPAPLPRWRVRRSVRAAPRLLAAAPRRAGGAWGGAGWCQRPRQRSASVRGTRALRGSLGGLRRGGPSPAVPSRVHLCRGICASRAVQGRGEVASPPYMGGTLPERRLLGLVGGPGVEGTLEGGSSVTPSRRLRPPQSPGTGRPARSRVSILEVSGAAAPY